ncbi:hypothetical protein GGS26DRAFT_280275 [Hypomontagnella submonticulosa]|nr:hypothetical protein GGS26DRAFT_280275 [Hypomontagnella submonticulosa]
MSADLFAAFEDTSKPSSSKGHPPKGSVQGSTFNPDPFSFGAGGIVGTSAHTGQNTYPNTQKWNHETTLWNSQLQTTSQAPLGVHSWTGAPSEPIQSITQEDEDEDGWGDFEVAENANQSSPPVTASSLSGSTTKEPQNPALQRTRVVRASTMDLMTNNLVDLHNLPAYQPEARESSAKTSSNITKIAVPKAAFSSAPKKAANANPNVLFDADEFDGDQQEEDDEDFGEFEAVASPVQTTSDLLSGDFHSAPKTTETKASQMLSGLNLNESTSYPQAPRSPSFQDRNPFPGLAVAPPTKTEKQPAKNLITSPVTAWPSGDQQNSVGSDGFGDDWATFDNLPSEKTKSTTATKRDSNWDWDSMELAKPRPKPTPANAQALPMASDPGDTSWDWDPVDIKTEKQVSEPKDDLPPTNVPPPSILLSVFPQLFDQANTLLYKPVSGQPFSAKNRILSDPKTIEYLKGYLALATVAARVIAGRKLRWHRDKFLAQRMSISAAGSKGMKLAGIDKTQAAREDREAADVVANWKEQIGRLRSAVAAANSSIKSSAEQMKVPEISESMQIQTEKMVPTAPKACVVCGLKRNERVSKVDHEVEDSFGEWWVDHWGHLACKRFWLQHENALRQR